jgi:muramoyltetrapeptide carboxypeptidase LdcA involved in peptidoglycan recycling
MKFIKPEKLKKGDTIGIVSASWGGPSVFPHIYESGLLALKKLGLKIKEFPSARKNADFIYNNPEFRAKDINDAFADSEVKAIIASIGGDDSVRILPYLDTKKILENPKILIGYSDTSTLTTYLNKLGLVTFNGPSIMAGFSQWDSLEGDFQKYISDFLFGEIEQKNYPTFDFYANGYPDWSKKDNVGKIKETFKNDGYHWLQGNLVTSGFLYGGCIEVLEFMKGTDFWPQKDFWNGKILFLETSEEKP